VESLITSGAVVWLILGIMAVEAIVLARLIKSFPGILAGLAAGGFMVLALGASLGNMGIYTIAACLGLSFICHGVEIWFWFKVQQRKLAP
jgi:hypothetical protein